MAISRLPAFSVRSIRIRLLCMIGATILPVLVLMIYSGETSRQQRVDLNNARLRQSAELIAAEHARVIENARQLLTAMAAAPDLLVENMYTCRKYLRRVQLTYQRYYAFILFNENGSAACEFPNIHDILAFSNPSIFPSFWDSRRFIVGKYATTQLNGVPLLPMLLPILDDQGVIVARLATALRLDWLGQYLRTASSPEGVSVTFVGPFGTVLASHPEGTEVVGTSPAWWRERKGDEGIVEADDRVIALAEAYAGGLTVAVGQARLEITETAAHLFWVQLATSAAVLIAAAGMAWSFGEFAIARRVRRLTGVVERLEAGNLKTRYNCPRRGDELDQLGQAFDRMANALERKVDELGRSNRELEQFANVVSHDLQEPLRMVTSYCELLGRRYKGRLDDEADQFIQFAVDGAQRMQLLIKDLLTFSRVGLRGQPLEATDADHPLELALSNLQEALAESDARITTGPLPRVLADKLQLMQLFQNLIANAIKYRRQRPPEIHVSAVRQGPFWAFAVTDNGIGIDSRFADGIFEIFKRLHTRDEYPGTGIGLAICKRIVERHGGEIWLDCEYRGGACFCFTLRAAR